MNIGARIAAFTEAGKLWKWPTEMTTAYASPASVWTPSVGVWYGKAARNGYFQNDFNGTFTSNSLTCRTTSGYSVGVFLRLPVGSYVLSFDCADVQPQKAISSYTASGSGYVLSRRIVNGVNGVIGHNEQSFSVVDGDDLILIVFTEVVPSGTSSSEYATYTNISIDPATT